MAEMDLQGLILPEDMGGSDATALELCIVLMETGRVLLPGPFLASAGLAVNLLRASGAAAATEWSVRLASGEAIGAGAVQLPGVLTEVAADKLTLRGSTEPVLCADMADVLVLVTGHQDAPLAIVDLRGPGVTIRTTNGVDPSRSFAVCTFDGAEAVGLAAEPDEIERALAAAALSVAAEQVGSAEAVLELTVGYALTRQQFGRPIGSFQAVKHRCADMFVDVERARDAVLAATHDHVERMNDPTEAFMAAFTAAQALGRVARSAIQVHGAIGFTWEHDAPRFLKRALSTEALTAQFCPLERALQSLATA